jgi:hypothetical protein
MRVADDLMRDRRQFIVQSSKEFDHFFSPAFAFRSPPGRYPEDIAPRNLIE